MDKETVVDIVSSESEYEEDRRIQPSKANKRAKTIVKSTTLTFDFDKSEGECSSNNSYVTSVKSSEDEYEDIESLTHNNNNKFEHNNPLLEKSQSKEKRKILNAKKAQKPPRPRKGPSLDTADLQLVKEIAEQTMKKRARVERLKALKKRRAVRSSSLSSSSSSTSSSSSNSSLFALAITVLFFLVIIFQGFGSGQSSTLTFDDSPKPSNAPSSGLISIQLGNNVLESNGVQQISKPPKKLSRRKMYRTTSSFMEQKSVSNSG